MEDVREDVRRKVMRLISDLIHDSFGYNLHQIRRLFHGIDLMVERKDKACRRLIEEVEFFKEEVEMGIYSDDELKEKFLELYGRSKNKEGVRNPSGRR